MSAISFRPFFVTGALARSDLKSSLVSFSGLCQLSDPHRPADSHISVCPGHVDVPVRRGNVEILGRPGC
jgi:hypothetical protein